MPLLQIRRFAGRAVYAISMIDDPRPNQGLGSDIAVITLPDGMGEAVAEGRMRLDAVAALYPVTAVEDGFSAPSAETERRAARKWSRRGVRARPGRTAATEALSAPPEAAKPE